MKPGRKSRKLWWRRPSLKWKKCAAKRYWRHSGTDDCFIRTEGCEKEREKSDSLGGRQAGSFYRRCVPGPYGCFYNTSDSGAVPVFNSVSMDRRDDQVHVCMDGVHLHRVCGKDRGTYKDNICAFLTQAGPETVSGYFM